MMKRIFAEWIISLYLLQHYACVSLVTTEENNDAKLDCTSSAKSVYTVASEMQCHHRCLRKENCEILNYKVTGTGKKDNCEVFDVSSDNHQCTKTSKANWKAVLTKRNMPQIPKAYDSCKDIKKDRPSAANGVYELTSGKHYCIMGELEGCGKGGWTLAMKIDGSKDTFDVESSYWINNRTYNVEKGLKSFETEEAKFPAFSSISFKQICLGMKTNTIIRWAEISMTNSSLLQLFKGGEYQPTKLGRTKWLSLIEGSYLQDNCNREGFNAKRDDSILVARIGILGNGEYQCLSPDSFIGFGSIKSTSECQPSASPISCGNYATCGTTKSVPAMGFLFVK